MFHNHYFTILLFLLYFYIFVGNCDMIKNAANRRSYPDQKVRCGGRVGVRMNGIVIRMIIIYSFGIWGAYATTDILRLLDGAELPVWKSSCHCPVCRQKIRLADQIPIFSYVHSKGKCRNCNSKIPLSDMFLELFIITGFTILSLCMDFSWQCLIACICIYELLKVGCILAFGVRKDGFVKNFVYSFFSNLLTFMLISFLFLLRHLC